MAGVPPSVVSRAQIISTDFLKAFKDKLDSRRRSDLPLQAHADFVYLMQVALGGDKAIDGGVGGPASSTKASLKQQLDVIRGCIGKYEVR
jgi:DNA mismatch repair protein MSH6